MVLEIFEHSRETIIVGFGGFVGAILRYSLGGWVQRHFTSYPDFPIGTFFVNFTGSLILSILMFGTQTKGWFDVNIRIFLTIGLLGAFTTMSTFNYETFRMIEAQRYGYAALNIFVNIVLGISAVFVGKIAVATIWK